MKNKEDTVAQGIESQLLGLRVASSNPASDVSFFCVNINYNNND